MEGLVIGRFQIVGNQHIDLFEQIENYHRTHPLQRLNVGIGVADTVDKKNPFSGTECLNMIRPVSERSASRMGIPTRYRLIPDINDPDNYEKHVSEIFGFNKDVTLFSSNEYTNVCFRDHCGFTVVRTKEQKGIHSTHIRKMYAEGKDISQYVPKHTIKFLKKHDAKRRLEDIIFKNPTPTVDIIIEYGDGIVIIDRKYSLKGPALPGGHVDYGESCESAAIREAKEETGLDIRLTGLIGIYSQPNRDPRGHRISVAYSAQGYGTLKAGSDAKEVKVVNKNYRGLVFDHDKILDDHFRDK